MSRVLYSNGGRDDTKPFANKLSEHRDDSRTVHDYRTGKDVARPYTTDENAIADDLIADSAQVSLEERVAALEAIVVGLMPVTTTPPSQGALAAKQAEVILKGQKITGADKAIYEAVNAPINANATPVTYSPGWAKR